MSQDRDSLLENADVNPCTSNGYLDHIESQPAEVINENSATNEAAKFPQILAGFSATLSALSAGLVLGWTSPILDYITHGKFNDIPINNDQMGWIGSFATLGAMAMCIPTGFICDLIGRKRALLLLIVPFSVGWALIFWARNVLFLYFGRIMTGMAVGACCVAAPLYNGEIAHQSLRGVLGSFFQLMIVTGVFLAYLVGECLTPYQFTMFCAGLPMLFLVVFAFQPESPSYLIKKGQFDEAKKCLARLRGSSYNVDAELIQIEGSLKESTQSSASLRDTFNQKAVIKAILISFALMFFQQFSGINVIILYSSNIFKMTGIKLNSNLATIVVGAVQALATLVSSLVIEKLGRKFLLFFSLSTVTINAVLLAIYFSIKTRGHPDSEVVSDIGFIPVVAVCLFVVSFSLGVGPIPWMIASEILPSEIRSIVSSAAGTFNWFLAFIITKTYLNLSSLVGIDSIFYGFTVFSLIGTVFILVMVPETKGKSVSQIQEELAQ